MATFGTLKGKYSFKEKEELLKVIKKNKLIYEESNATYFDPKRKKRVVKKPKEGYISKSIREYYIDLKDVPSKDPSFQKARKMAERCLVDGLGDVGVVGPSSAKKFRQAGAGRPTKAPEVRLAMFDWFLDIRGSLKGRLPKKMFISKCKEVYSEWLEQQDSPVPVNEQLKFTDPWLQGWMQEYGVSLRKPNKRFAISQENRVDRVLEYLQNVWRVRYFFLKNFNIVPKVYNGDQMPLHRNESSSQKTLTFKGMDTFVKENYMLSRERITAYTQLISEEPFYLPPEFVFKGKGTRTKLDPPSGVHFQWAVKGSYRIEQMLETIKHLPNKSNPFTCKNFDIYVLDNYSVHCTDEVKQALLSRGYVPVVMGGGITGDIQINDTHLHSRLKSIYREKESSLMIEQLKENPNKVPSPNRDEMMKMLNDAHNLIDFDIGKGFKSLFVTNDFDGSEDYMVCDAIQELVGERMVEFREKLLKSTPPKTIKELMKSIKPPKGVKTKKLPSANEIPGDEGFEIWDGEEQDSDNDDADSDDEADSDNDSDDDNSDIDDLMEMNDNTEDAETVRVDSNKEKNFSMSKLAEGCHDADVLKDAKLLDAMSNTLKNNEYSSRLFSFVIQTNANLRKWRRNLKIRIRLGKEDSDRSCRSVDEVIEDEIFDERCGHVVKEPKDDNKCAECNKQYEQSDKEWLECPMCKQWYHNEDCFM